MVEVASSISRTGGTPGWLWNFRPGNAARLYIKPDRRLGPTQPGLLHGQQTICARPSLSIAGLPQTTRQNGHGRARQPCEQGPATTDLACPDLTGKRRDGERPATPIGRSGPPAHYSSRGPAVSLSGPKPATRICSAIRLGPSPTTRGKGQSRYLKPRTHRARQPSCPLTQRKRSCHTEPYGPPAQHQTRGPAANLNTPQPGGPPAGQCRPRTSASRA